MLTRFFWLIVVLIMIALMPFYCLIGAIMDARKEVQPRVAGCLRCPRRARGNENYSAR